MYSVSEEGNQACQKYLLGGDQWSVGGTRVEGTYTCPITSGGEYNRESLVTNMICVCVCGEGVCVCVWVEW